MGAVSYDQPEPEDVPQYVYMQIPQAGEQLLEGEAVTLRLSADIEKAAGGHSIETENEEWF